jgi:hypothetical protein
MPARQTGDSSSEPCGFSPSGGHLEDSALRRRFYAAREQAQIKQHLLAWRSVSVVPSS